MSAEKSPEGGRAYPPAYRIWAVVAILALIFGGGWASIGPSGRPSFELRAGMKIAALGRRLRPESISAIGVPEAARVAEKLVRAARRAGIDPRDALGSAFPEPHRILGMLALDLDIDEFLEYGAAKGALGAYYRDEVRVSREMRPLRSRYEAVFAASYMKMTVSPAMAGQGSAAPDRPYITAAGEAWLPSASELQLNHPYALDIFFKHVEEKGEAETGPILRALYPGIVVASASDWVGGQGPGEWKSGGLSPAAGNGLVIYDPSARVYCSYFHMSTVGLGTGSIVRAGDTLGRGGNSGMNARRKGHGGHVHIEIFDAEREKPFTAYEILEILKK